MAQMVVIYRKPKNPEEFEKHYHEVHVPLAKKLPGLRRYEVSRAPVVTIAGAPDTYMVATLTFDDLESIRTAFATEVGRACAADRKVLAPEDEDAQMFLFDTCEV